MKYGVWCNVFFILGLMDTRTYFNTNKFEIEANKFAMELLISDEILNEYIEYSIQQIARML